MAFMRGDDRQPDAMFSYVSAEQRVPMDHPLRAIRGLVDEVLHDMTRKFDGLYASVGRTSIPPERCCQLAKASWLAALRFPQLAHPRSCVNRPSFARFARVSRIMLAD